VDRVAAYCNERCAGAADVASIERAFTDLAQAVLRTALTEVNPPVPFAIVAMGRFGGAELSYASDSMCCSCSTASDLTMFATPKRRREPVAVRQRGNAGHALWTLDVNLRPEGRQGPLARSLGAFEAYYERWAQLWDGRHCSAPVRRR